MNKVLSNQNTEVERTHRQPMFLQGTMDSIIIILLHCLFTVFRDLLSFSFVWLPDLYINVLAHVGFSFLWY